MSSYVLGERAANAVRKLMAGESSVATDRSSAGGPVDVQEFALPWTVEWAQSENSGSGKWIIWLPSEGSFTDLIGVYGAAFSVMLSGMANAQHHEGWKIIDDTSSGTLCLVIIVDEEHDPPLISMRVSFDTTEGTIIIPIANVNRNREFGTHPPVYIRQYQSGELVFSKGGGSGPDFKSIDYRVGDNTLELLEFQTKEAESDTLIKTITGTYGESKELVERDNIGDGNNTVKYRKTGVLYGGSDSNVVFTPDANGDVSLDVYYL